MNPKPFRSNKLQERKLSKRNKTSILVSMKKYKKI